MKYLWHFLVPLVAGYLLTGESTDISVKLTWIFQGCVVIGLPYILWSIACMKRRPAIVVHSGFAAAHAVVLLLMIGMYSSDSRESANIWFAYFPLVAFAITVAAMIATAVADWRERRRS